MIKKLIFLGTILTTGIQIANADLASDRRSRAAVSALMAAKGSLGVINNSGTRLTRSAGDVAFEMTTGTSTLVAKPEAGTFRKVRVNAPCQATDENAYKCAYCVAFKEGNVNYIEKLMFNVEIDRVGNDYEAVVISDDVKFRQDPWDERAEPCTTPN